MASLNIENYTDVEDRLIKVYPYEFINASKSKTFVLANSVSIAEISQDNLDTDDELLLKDENGNKYFEMFAAITSEGKLDNSTTTSTLGQILLEEDNFVCLSNYYYEGELENIKIGNMRFMPAVFSIGKPYNKDEYNAGEQAMFIPTSMVEALEGQSRFVLSDIDPEGLYEFSLTNLSSIESAFTNTIIRLHLNDGSNKSLLNPKVDDGTGKLVPGISVSMDNYSLINKLTAKVGLGEETTDLDLKTSAKLIPFKSTPISTQDKVTMFMDYFDYDVVMPEFIASNFLGTGDKLEILKTVQVDISATQREPFFGDPEIDLIKDMLAYSLAYSTSFSQFERNATGSDAGKIKAELTIGSTKAKLVAIEGKDPIKVIDGIYETYIRTYPSEEGSVKNRAVKQILAALSRFIFSSYAIGKGQNSFNEIYLPWFLRPTNKITLENVSGNYILNEDAGFKLQSRWFDTTQNAITVKDETDISSVKLIQTDRKLTVPEVPDSITALNKLPLPGDINTKSSDDISFMWYLPFKDNLQFERLFLNTATVTTDNNNQVQPVTMPDGPEGLPYIYTGDDVIKTAALQYRASVANVTLDSVGKTVKIDSKEITDSKEMDENDSGYEALAKLLPEYPNLTNNSKITDDIVKEFVANLYGYKPEYVRVDANFCYWTRAHGQTHRYDSFHMSYQVTILRDRVIEATVKVKSAITKITIDRETLYDKPKWKRYVEKDLQFGGIPVPFKLLSQYDEPINNIDEISIHSIWGDKATITINGMDFNIPLFNTEDETIGVQKILFT